MPVRKKAPKKAAKKAPKKRAAKKKAPKKAAKKAPKKTGVKKAAKKAAKKKIVKKAAPKKGVSRGRGSQYHRRPKVERERADRAIAAMSNLGMDQSEIALKLGISQSWVSKRLNTPELRQGISQMYSEEKRDLLTRDLIRLDVIIQTAWAQFERSCLPKSKVKLEASVPEEPTPTGIDALEGNPETEQNLGRLSDLMDSDPKLMPGSGYEITREHQCGDSKYLNTMLKAIDQKAELLGFKQQLEDAVPLDEVRDAIRQMENIFKEFIDLDRLPAFYKRLNDTGVRSLQNRGRPDLVVDVEHSEA